MHVTETQLTVTQILQDLDNGLTWYKKDDAGYGSIQEKYKARDQQIAVIRKGHPLLAKAETALTIFTIIDDTANDTTTTVSVSNGSNEKSLGSLPATDKGTADQTNAVPPISNKTTENRVGPASEPAVTVEESAGAFFNL